jgi:hypothetical protein
VNAPRDRRPARGPSSARPIGAVLAVAVALLFGSVAASVVAQEPLTTPTTSETTPPTETTPTPTTDATGTPEPIGPPVVPDATPETERRTREALRRTFESPSAAARPEPAKTAEKLESCKAGRRLPTSGMQRLRPGRVTSDQRRSRLALAIGALGFVAALAGVLWLARRRRASSERKGPLDVVAAVVAIAGGIAALAAQFIPGVGVREQPPPEIAMTVTQVHARVQRASYAAAVNAEAPRGLDRQEIGNVVWLRIDLRGFDDDALELEWAEYNVNSGGALLPDTEDRRRLHVTEPAETRFEPVWVGYPRSGRFQVQFRVVDRGKVLGMARTGPMQGTQYRYGCNLAR